MIEDRDAATADGRGDDAPPPGLGARIRVRTHATMSRGAQQSAEPITLGVPFARGACREAAELGLRDGAGGAVALQTEVLNRWPDGSIRWVLLDFQHRSGADLSEFTLGQSSGVAAPIEPLRVEQSSDQITIDTGAARFRINREIFPIAGMQVGDVDILDSARTQLRVEDAEGRVWRTRIDDLTLEESGPLRSVVRLTGVIGDAAEPLQLIARLHFFAGLPTLRVAMTVRNPRAASHPGGFWELGDPGSVLLREVSVQVGLRNANDASVHCSAERGEPLTACAGTLEVYQDSSGGENWGSVTHLNRNGRVPNGFRGYRRRDEMGDRVGLRATPHVAITGGAGGWASVTMPEFWQNFPKAIEADCRSIAVSVWPRQYGDVHELQPGEQKTHLWYLNAGTSHTGPEAFEWCREPSIAHADPEWYCSSGAIPYLVPAVDDPHHAYLKLVEAAIEGPDTFLRKREVVDEYGWRNFGELYADHEAALDPGPEPLVSHYNNQYDAVAGFGYHFMRTGDVRWWRLMQELATHVVDIDIYHTDADRSIYNQGLFWHTFHYAKADRCTHRTYASSSPSQGGGPSAEHNYANGLALHYFLTGDRASKEAAVGLAGWVIAMEDGRRAPLWWLASGATGFASASGSPLYHGPGRGPANAIAVLLQAHQLTGEPRWLASAEELIRRCIHPNDDVAERRLHEVEQRWFYTVFLQSLGRYLHYKQSLGEPDGMYAYAQGSLLRYARWMVEHEAPYLDRPEVLEYPNETWIAQDVRKSEVLCWAAAHARGAERARFESRATFFFDYATNTLLADARRTLTRPLVLILTNGWLRAGMARTTPAYPAVALPAVGAPVGFVPQKIRAIQRAKLLAASLVGGAGLLVLKWLL